MPALGDILRRFRFHGVPGAPTVLLGNFPILDNTSVLNCIWGGVIQFVTPGEFTVMVP